MDLRRTNAREHAHLRPASAIMEVRGRDTKRLQRAVQHGRAMFTGTHITRHNKPRQRRTVRAPEFVHRAHGVTDVDASALKRGVGAQPVSWDAHEAEEGCALDAAGGLSPEQLFERQWAQALIYAVLERARVEFTAGGKGGLFDELEPHLWSDETSTPYAAVGRRLGMTVVALRVTLHRLRRRFHDLLREEIWATVDGDAEVDDEVAHLRRALANG